MVRTLDWQFGGRRSYKSRSDRKWSCGDGCIKKLIKVRFARTGVKRKKAWNVDPRKKSVKQKRIRHKGYFPLYQADRSENRTTSNAWTDIVESKCSIFIFIEIFTFLFKFPPKFELRLNEKGLEMIRSKRITSARISMCFELSTVGDKLLLNFGARF